PSSPLFPYTTLFRSINEGSYGWADLLGSSRPIFGFAPTEKGPCWLQLHVEGPPGHGSLPHDQNALAVLARAMYRIDSWQRPRTRSEEHTSELQSRSD